MNFTTDFQLVSRLGMSGAIPPFPTYTFITWTGIKSPSPLLLHIWFLRFPRKGKMSFCHRLTSLSYTILYNIHRLNTNDISRGKNHTCTASSAENLTHSLLLKSYETSLYYIWLFRSFKAKFLFSFKPNQSAYLC